MINSVAYTTAAIYVNGFMMLVFWSRKLNVLLSSACISCEQGIFMPAPQGVSFTCDDVFCICVQVTQNVNVCQLQSDHTMLLHVRSYTTVQLIC